MSHTYEKEMATATAFAKDPHCRTKKYSAYLQDLRDRKTDLPWSEYRAQEKKKCPSITRR